MLALRGKQHALNRWRPTADYLSEHIEGLDFEIVPLDFDELEPAVANQTVDFVLANSRYYVLLERRYRVSRIATLRNRSPAGALTRFGGVLIARRERTDIHRIEDLTGKKLAAVHRRSLGGWLALQGELLRHGMEAEDDLERLSFLGTHDAVVYAVLSGEADAGTVRSDMLERMSQEGRLDMDRLRILGKVSHPGFPYHVSTQLYPEWPFASLGHIPEPLLNRVAMTLLMMPPDSPSAIAAQTAGWSVPANYQPVHELLQLLHLPPYAAEPHPTLKDALLDHKASVATFLILLAGLLAHLYRFKSWNRSLTRTKNNLEIARMEQDKAHQRLKAAFASISTKEQLLDKITDTALDGIVMLDDQGRITFANPAATQLFGYTHEEFIGLNLHAGLIPQQQRQEAALGYREFVKTGQGWRVGKTVSLEAIRKNGEVLPVELSVAALNMGGRWHAIGIIRDMRESQRMEQALAEHTESFRTLVEENRAGILILDETGDIRFANSAATRLFSVSVEELKRISTDIPIEVGSQIEVGVKRHDGSRGTAAAVITETVWKDAPAYLVMLYDITERKVREEQMRQLAFEDTLTNLPNRNQFRLRLDEAIKQARRDNTGFALLFMDLNRFKEINDNLGHAIGDQLLRQVAERLGSLFRESDMVARMGGDEFTAIAYGAHDEQAARQVAERIAHIFEPPFQLEGKDFDVSTSVGISLFPHSSTDPDILLRQADSAMYDAKRNKGGNYSIYAPHIALMSQTRFELEAELIEALEKEQFRLYYQPAIRLSDGALIGMEGLLRWQHPHKGLLTPDAFITLLEDTGLILDVGRWALRKACQQALTWQENRPNLTVSINISPIQVERGDLLGDVKQAVEDIGLEPRLLHLEMTEAAMFRGAGHTTDLLKALADMGVGIQLDDCSAGDSSRDMIARLPFSVIKIDREHIRDITVNPAKRTMVKANIAMAHGLNKQTIAEGVETQAQLDALSALDCDAAQGYLFGKPLPAEKLAL